MIDAQALKAFCLDAVQQSGLSAVAELFHSFRDHALAGAGALSSSTPVGITGVVLLAESHCAIHTWPEKEGVTLDVYVCNYGQDNSAKARRLLQTLISGFAPSQADIREVLRK
jgi:S-adenosylmethionine decarboxylase